MPGFKYQAYEDDGRLRSGVLEADSARTARAALRQQGLTPYRVEVIEASSGAQAPTWHAWIGAGTRLDRLALMRFTRGLASLTDAGLTLEQSFNALIEQAETPRERQLIARVRSEVMAGSTLARALAGYPGTFSELYRTLVAAGEAAGQLPKVLERLADHLEARASVASKLAVAMIYPLLVLLVSMAVIIALMTYVVPQVVEVFVNAKASLPPLTRALIAVSAAIQQYGVALLIATGIAAAAFAWAIRRPAVQSRLQTLLLRLPVVGRLLRALDSARLSATLAILTGSGVPLLAALNAAGGVLRMAPLRLALQQAKERVQAGASLASALRETRAYPPILTHLIASGESTGRLDQALARAAKEQESEAVQRISTLSAIAEPAIILFVGLLVLAIVLAVLLPIFELNRLVSTK
jgi:general secretion pathway protein F